ncbi:retrovirus-related Pol polyprotein from transposon TNT 1-94, partial [Trichonephila clavipes]
MPSTSEKPGVSSDNHNLIPCTEDKWIRNIDLSEQQEALMVEVTIPNCYKQAIRSRDASKWHDAMDKESNVMKERKVWDLVDHPDNIKILENRWVYTIKYDLLFQYSQVQISKLTPITQSKPLKRSPAPAIPLIPATDFHVHHHHQRAKTKPIQEKIEDGGIDVSQFLINCNHPTRA